MVGNNLAVYVYKTRRILTSITSLDKDYNIASCMILLLVVVREELCCYHQFFGVEEVETQYLTLSAQGQHPCQQ